MRIQNIGNYSTNQNRTNNPNFGMILTARTIKAGGVISGSSDAARAFVEKNQIARANFEMLKQLLAQEGPKNIEVIAEKPHWLKGGTIMFSFLTKLEEAKLYPTGLNLNLLNAGIETLRAHTREIKKFYDKSPILFEQI